MPSSCTLTKSYMATELRDQRFNAVVVDEISMALPPLIFLAAARATDRVILVGDFLQLPPIVRSDSEVSNARLRQDTFHLAGVASGLRPADSCRVLTRLTTQRRMAPAIADAARHLVYGPDGIRDDGSVVSRQPAPWLDFLHAGPLLVLDTADLRCWSGKQPGSLSRFNFYSATVAVELAAMAAHAVPEPRHDEPPPIGIVTPFAAQRRLLSRLVVDLGLARWVLAGTVHTFQGGEADLIVFDAVLDEPYWSARLTTPSDADDVKRELNVAVTRARHKFVFLASSEWLNKHAKPASALGQLWWFLKDRAPLVSARDVVEFGFAQRALAATSDAPGWRLPSEAGVAVHEILDETTFFQRFAGDMSHASNSVFGLAPYFGEYRWPRVEPLFRAALERGVEVTLVIPPRAEAQNPTYVDALMANLRRLGGVVVEAGGLHGKDVVIDETSHYTGSLNWASHRGRAEVMHRTESRAVARLVLEYIQARYIRAAAVHENGTPRRCPECGGPVWVVNQRRQHGAWDFQAMKVGCVAYHRTGCRYLRNIDERAPFRDAPRCQRDHVTKYRRVRRGKGEVWQCPKHPKECETMKLVPGDPD
ncbi:MAG: AAA domain-containing protein [Armatimonadota bacterium]